MAGSTVLVTICGKPVNLSMLLTRRNAVLVVGLFAAICGMAVSGFLYSFNAFADALKEQLALSQTQVEWISSVANIGSCIGITAGLFMQRFGTQVTVCVAALVSFAGFFVVAASIEHRIASHFSLMCVYFFVIGQGGIFTYMACMVTTAVNFSPQVRGTVIGLVDAMYGGSAAIFSAVYSRTYGKSDVAREQDVAGFFYSGAAIMAGVNLFLFVALRWRPWQGEHRDVKDPVTSFDKDVFDNSEEYTASHEESGRAATPVVSAPSLQASPASRSLKTVGTPNTGNVSNHDGQRDRLLTASTSSDAQERRGGGVQSQPNLNTLQLMLNGNFHLLFWSFALSTGVGLMFMSNVLFFLKAYGVEEENRDTFTVVLPVCSLVSRFVSGVVSDALHARHVPRSLVLLVTESSLLVAQALLLVWPGSLRVLLANAICVGVSYGSLWCLVPTIMTQIGGLKYFGQNWGIVMLSSALAGMGYQELYRKVYDEHVAPATAAPSRLPWDAGRPVGDASPTSSTCYGTECFALTTYVTVASCALSLLLVLVLCVRDYRALQRARRGETSAQ